MSHTILFIQTNSQPISRTYSDYESAEHCFEGVLKMYETHLKRRNPNTPVITYQVSDFFNFVDQLADLSCVVYQQNTKTYAPYSKEWIKEKVYVLLKQTVR